MTAHVILLHGPSSSGKSTTARAIQDLVELPFWHISIDHLRDGGVLPTARIARGDFSWPDLRKPIFDGFHGSLAAYASSGNNLIVEHIFDNPEWVDDLKLVLAPFDVFFVGLQCDPEELRRREMARGDRPRGSAERDYQSVHLGRVYDMELDGRKNATQNARRVLECWSSGRRTSEFARPSHPP